METKQMSHRLRLLISPFAAMAGILVVGMATPARADLEIWASTTGPPTAANLVANTPSGGGFQSVSFNSANFGGFIVGVLATSSNTPGTPTLANLTGSSVNITNNNATTSTLWITLGDTSYMAPTAPPGVISVNSHVSNTVVVGNSANMETFHSFVNPDNSQNGTTGFDSGAQTPDIRGPASSISDVVFNIANLPKPYSVTETFKITLGAGAAITFSSNTTLTLQAVPEPSTAAIAGLGAMGLIGYGLRRRKARLA
jgi:hypothetical protein